MKKAKFYVSESPSFEGYYDPSVNWNGFACPYFTLEVLDKIVEHFQDELRRDDFTRGSIYSPETGQLFSINNCYWCWQIDTSEVDKLAIEFSKVLHSWLTPEEMTEVNIRNDEPRYKDHDCCATHDFCDANMAMVEAMTTLKYDARDESSADLWNAAWIQAKANKFNIN